MFTLLMLGCGSVVEPLRENPDPWSWDGGPLDAGADTDSDSDSDSESDTSTETATVSETASETPTLVEGDPCVGGDGSPGTVRGGGCCTGCWDGVRCWSGETEEACGLGGVDCETCTSICGYYLCSAACWQLLPTECVDGTCTRICDPEIGCSPGGC